MSMEVDQKKKRVVEGKRTRVRGQGLQIKIEEKIQALINWCMKYPRAKVYLNNPPMDVIKEYSHSEKEYKELLTQFKKMQEDYCYVRERKSKGGLTEAQKESCKEGNLQGVFGFPSCVSQLAKKYRIREDKIVHILDYYGTMDQFLDVYRKGKMSEVDKTVLKDNIKRYFDINLQGNQSYDRLLLALVRKGAGSEIKRETQEQETDSFILYDSNELISLVQDKNIKIKERDRQVFERRFGIQDGHPETLASIGGDLGMTRQGIAEIEERALRKISRHFHRERGRLFFEKSLSTEGRDRMDAIKDIIFDSNEIFYPDNKYALEPSNMDVREYYRNLEYLMKLQEDDQNKKEVEKKGETEQVAEKFDFDTRISDLGVPVRVMHALNVVGIYTLGDLKSIPREDFSRIRNLGKESIKQLLKKLDEIGFYSDSFGNQGLETLKKQKAELEEYIQEKKAELHKAEEILDNYDRQFQPDGSNPEEERTK